MGKPRPPDPPDYAGAAREQGAANQASALQTSMLGTPFYETPYGGQAVDWSGSRTGSNEIPYIHQWVPPVAQATIDQQQQAGLGLAQTANEQAQNVRGLLNTPFSFGGTPQQALDLSQVAKMPVNAGTTGQAAIMARLAPELARRRTSTETQLVNQGLRPGGEAYDNAIDAVGRQENDLLSQAALQGINLDLGANQQGFGQALQQGQFGNTALQQMLAQALTQRDLPINEITALMSGSQIQNPQFPGYQGGVVAPAPLFNATQAQGQFDQNTYAQQVAQYNSMLGGIFGLAAAPFGMFSFGGK